MDNTTSDEAPLTSGLVDMTINRPLPHLPNEILDIIFNHDIDNAADADFFLDKIKLFLPMPDAKNLLMLSRGWLSFLKPRMLRDCTTARVDLGCIKRSINALAQENEAIAVRLRKIKVAYYHTLINVYSTLHRNRYPGPRGPETYGATHQEGTCRSTPAAQEDRQEAYTSA